MPSRRIRWVPVAGFALIFMLAPALRVFAQAPSAVTGSASSISASGAVLNGTVNANGASTSVVFEYGLDTSYGATAAATESPVTGSTATPVSAVLGELLPNTTYHYRVVATNANGTTNGADMTLTTLPASPSVLTSPATGIGADSATLNGVVNANGDSTSVTFEYGTDTSYGTTVTADQSPLDMLQKARSHHPPLLVTLLPPRIREIDVDGCETRVGQ